MVVAKTERLVRDKLGEEPTGHDWWHADRVRNTAMWIAGQAGADGFVVELAALLHDVDDYKFSGDEEAGPSFACAHLRSAGVSAEIAEHVADSGRKLAEERHQYVVEFLERFQAEWGGH